MFDGLTRRMRRGRKFGALVPIAAAAALAVASTPAQAGKPTPPPPPPTHQPPKPPPPPPPPPPTVPMVNGKCPPGYVPIVVNPKNPSAQKSCGRKVG